MKTRLFHFLTLLVLLAGLFPATVALADGDDGNYEFKGIVVSFPAGWVGDWLVNDGFTDRVVHASTLTRIKQEHGPIAVDACVEVKGWLQADSSVNATKIETKEAWKCGGSGGGGTGQRVEFRGTIMSSDPLCRPGDVDCTWTVGSQTVNITSMTRIDEEHGPAVSGAYVEVKGVREADLTVTAHEIEVKIASGGGPGGRSYTEFYGTIRSLPASGLYGIWVVNDGSPDGRQVDVDTSTRIEQEHGPVAKDVCVEVKGWLDGSVINATKVETKEPYKCGGSGGGSSSGSRYTKFYGTVDNFPDGYVGFWTISGQTVEVTVATRINEEHGSVAVGAYVEVKGTEDASGNIIASEIEVKSSPVAGSGHYNKFYGTVESFPPGFIGDWTISGRTVRATAATRIDEEHGSVAVGAYVEVEGTQPASGPFMASKIEVKRSSGSSGGSVGYTKFYGILESIGPAPAPFIEDWQVNGTTVHITATTIIDTEHGPVQTGVRLEVKGIRNSDDTVTASKIEVKP